MYPQTFYSNFHRRPTLKHVKILKTNLREAMFNPKIYLKRVKTNIKNSRL